MFINSVARVIIYGKNELALGANEVFYWARDQDCEAHSTGGYWSEAGGLACVPVTTSNESKFYEFR